MPIARHIRDTLAQREPGAAIQAALERLLEVDDHLLRVDANERSLTFRFAMHLQAVLPHLHVDCEYNRTGIEPKRIAIDRLHTDVGDTEGKTVFPDVIAHIRGTQQNYLVIEFKKSSSGVADVVDFQKLGGYQGDRRLRYAFAVFIVLQVGLEPGVSRVEWVG